MAPLVQVCVYPWEAECNMTATTAEASDPTAGPETTSLPDTTASGGGCEAGPTGNACDYGDVLIPSPECCDYYRQCSNNIEYEMPCQVGADGERLWFDGQLGVGLHFIPQYQQLFSK